MRGNSLDPKCPSSLIRLALLYQDASRLTEAKDHDKAAVAENGENRIVARAWILGLPPMWLPRFHVAQHRMSWATFSACWKPAKLTQVLTLGRYAEGFDSEV
jgi:hypothetical protein